VFDVDRTLIIGTSAEEELIHLLRRMKIINIGHVIKNFAAMARQIPHGFVRVVKQKSLYLKHMEVDLIRRLFLELYENDLQKRLSRQMLETMERLREAGYEIWLLSGTLDFIVDHMKKELRTDGGIGSPLEISEGRFTGQIAGIHPYYHEKVRVLKETFRGRNIDYARSCSFGDSWADIPQLKLFGTPVAVNPGWRLRLEARRRGWKIVEERL
jgi:HAD superfamily hydrolase (TIGR01490 family)